MLSGRVFDSGFLKKLEQLEIHTRYLHTTDYESGIRGTWKGGEVEFSDYKAYSPGDDIRYIDWNVYGRLESFVSKVFSAEEINRTYFLLDTSSSMCFSSKQPAAMRLAASLAAVALMGGDIVDIALVSDSVNSWCGEVQGRECIYPVLEFLEHAVFEGETDLSRVCSEVSFSKKGAGRIVLISDFWSVQNPAEYLNLLSGAEKEVSCIHLISREEVTPSLRGRFILTCPETGRQVPVLISQHESDLYQEAMEKHIRSIETACASARCDYVMVYDTAPVEQILFGQLREKGILSQRLM